MMFAEVLEAIHGIPRAGGFGGRSSVQEVQQEEMKCVLLGWMFCKYHLMTSV